MVVDSRDPRARLVMATRGGFKNDKTMAGAIAGAFGFSFRGVLQTHFPPRDQL